MSRQTTRGFDSGNGGHHHRVRYERDDSEPPSVAVATALAEYNGEDVQTASTQLYDYIDPEALDALFAPRYSGDERADGQVRFEVEGAMVVVRPTSIQVHSAD
ncbi:hypothetical protein OB955_07225 [Halobacteria archaeon AArc-m2/3/4]|uniref:Halobacterial output domain-containing protein n=1 Tax=Natronoglomus mannanivorans TaxID=2979990 RepID=A0AAP3E0V8_9EURY|nr:hypothetical protein [Halobacteria archaeon AArc-xg1-1]MCU4972528.1 hypothetical protein [Halobacteria archaeon AArc-m2/3/4]